MKYVAIANLKGGVGKSTTTMMLADVLAAFHHLSVLVIDLDPQSNSSFMLLSRQGAEVNEQIGKTFMHFLDAFRSPPRPNLACFVHPKASDLISLHEKKANGRVDLISSSPRMWFSEARFEKSSYLDGQEPDVILAAEVRAFLDRIGGSYDVVLFDCPPGFSTLARAGIRMADAVLSPTLSDDISARSLKDFAEVGLREIIQQQKPHYVVVTRHVQHIVNEIMVDRLRKDYTIIGTIKYSVDIVRACYRSRHDSFRDFREKYGTQHSSVRELGAAFIRTLDLHGG